MKNIFTKHTFERIYDFFTKRIVYHSVLWIAYILSFTAIQSYGTNQYWFWFSNQLILAAFYAAGVYFNIFYLIPNYLSQKKFATYAVLMTLSSFVITPLQLFFLWMKATPYPDYQQYIYNNQPYLFLATFIFILVSTLMKIISDWARHQREKKELETQTMQSELRFLKSQINPHFLFNTLNNLYALTLKKSDKAPEIVVKLSEMMRYMLYECNEKWVPLYKEVNYLRNYMDLERLRQSTNVAISFEVAGNVSNQHLAPLLFIPFIENSFKHGISNNLEEGFVTINLSIDPEAVHLYIENSKPSMPAQFHKRSGGIGLVNVRRRLDLLYPDKYDLSIEDTPTTYGVNLEINLV
ncbi:MAG: sensor histidine kinase [Saprospiraceae bacterium]